MAKKQSAINKLLGRNKPEPEKNKGFMKTGYSPIPGITLRQVLDWRIDNIKDISWSADGKYLFHVTWEQSVWRGKPKNEGLPGERLVRDLIVRSWEIETGRENGMFTLEFEVQPTESRFHDVSDYQKTALSPDGLKLAACHITEIQTSPSQYYGE